MRKGIRLDIDPEADAILFIPITAVMMAITVVMIAALVPESVLIAVAIVGPGRAGRSQNQHGKGRARDEEHAPFML
jgi:hypothetical protein